MKKKVFILSLIIALYSYAETTGPAITTTTNEKTVTSTTTTTPKKSSTKKEEVKKDNKKEVTSTDKNKGTGGNVVDSNVVKIKEVTNLFSNLTKDLEFSDEDKTNIEVLLKKYALKDKILDEPKQELEKKQKEYFDKNIKPHLEGLLSNDSKKEIKSLEELNKVKNDKLFAKALVFEIENLLKISNEIDSLSYEAFSKEISLAKEIDGFVCDKNLSDFKENLKRATATKINSVKGFYDFSKGLVEDGVFGKDDQMKFVNEGTEKKIDEKIIKNFEDALGKISTDAYEKEKANIEGNKKLSKKEKEEKIKELNKKWERSETDEKSVVEETQKEPKKINIVFIGIITAILTAIITMGLIIRKKIKTIRRNDESKIKKPTEGINDIYKLDIGNAAHQGKRKEQQDEYKFSNIGDQKFVKHGGILAVVCDGMGGMKNGRDASNLACAEFVKEYSAKKESESVSAALSRALLRSNERVYQQAESSGVAGASGTTLIATVIKDNKLNFVSVGDSFIYLFRDIEIN